MKTNQKIGLALSGGGYRASAFHLGTLRKLHEMKILPHVDVLSTISGGSITGACYCIQQEDFNTFEDQLKADFHTKSVIRQILLSVSFFKLAGVVVLFLGAAVFVLFTPVPWLSPLLLIALITVLLKYQFKIFPVSKEIEKAYNNFFYKGKRLKDLNTKPELAIGSTNLQTSRPFTFSRNYMGDSAYDYPSDGKPPIRFKAGEFPLARAVVASSCVPFAFTPIPIKKEYYQNPEDRKRINPQIVDGGVYDNQGIHKITQAGSYYECDIVITSDAGNKLPFEQFYNNTIILLIRTVDVFMNRIKNFQMAHNLYQNIDFAQKQIAYLSLGWDLEDCIPGFIENLIGHKIIPEVIAAHQLKKEWVAEPAKYRADISTQLKINTDYPNIEKRNLTKEELEVARGVKTNLTRLSVQEIEYLSRQAANLTELQVKLYCPALVPMATDKVLG